MKAKALEIRDEGTFIAALAVEMNPEFELNDASRAQRYLLRRCGYPCDGKPNVMLTKMMGDGSPASNDPHHWRDRTIAVAHLYIIEHWPAIKDGDVIDVEFILGEKPMPKVSERLSEGR